MLHSYKQQQGIGLLSALFVIVMLGLVFLSGLKLGPVYFEHYRLQRALESLATQKLPARARASAEKTTAIQKILLRKLNIDSVRTVKMKNIKVTSTISGVKVKVEYEVRTSFLGNVSFLVSFFDEVTLAK